MGRRAFGGTKAGTWARCVRVTGAIVFCAALGRCLGSQLHCVYDFRGVDASRFRVPAKLPMLLSCQARAGILGLGERAGFRRSGELSVPRARASTPSGGPGPVPPETNSTKLSLIDAIDCRGAAKLHNKARATAAKMRVRTVLPLLHAIAAYAKPETADSYANITGVPLWGQQHYVNGYRCADGTIIPRARVNDDACDCVSGGDEPGTSACAGRQQFFWCAADRRFIPSSRVGDGVVDCCDGADEAMRTAPPTGPRLMPRCPASHDEVTTFQKGAARRRERQKRNADVRSGLKPLPTPIVDFDAEAARGMLTLTREGVPVHLPRARPPYRSQLQVMDGAIRAVRAARSALLESPTGTGKTLAALAAVLAWQRQHAHDTPTRVVWVARTHDQLQHAVHEYKRSCPYRPLMSLRLSRERFCLHPNIATAPNKAKKREKQPSASFTGEAAGCNASPDLTAKQPNLKKRRVA